MEQLKRLFLSVYGDTPKTNKLFEDLVLKTKEYKKQRSQDLKKLDENKYWYFDPKIVGMTIYVDHLAKDFKDLKSKIAYFKELGITFIHLMPLLILSLALKQILFLYWMSFGKTGSMYV